MLLAIKGEVNNVYKLHRPDCNTIEKYIKEIPHLRTRSKKQILKWAGIKVLSEPLRFRDCVNKLKELGIIPKDEIVESCSYIQNIEDANERSKHYKDAKQARMEKKTGNSQDKESTSNENPDKDYDRFYADEEPEIKKMPGEFELTEIDMSLQENARGYFLWYIAEGGDRIASGDFKGKVLKIEKNKGILFKEIFVQFDEMDGRIVDGKEDHVWIFDAEEFIKMGVKVGDCVKFKALAYAYKRKDGSIDFGLKSPQWIQYIHDYELPSDEKLTLQSIERLVCETCMYSEQCYSGICIAAPGYKEIMTVQFLEASGVSKEFIDDYIINHPIPNLILEINTLECAYEILENYYTELLNYTNGSNVEGYNIDIAYTKERLEKIISNNYELTEEDRQMLKGLLEDVKNINLVNAINFILSD